MKLVGLAYVRNEEWILGMSLRAMLELCDEVAIVDHGSTDRTPEIIREVADEHPGRVHCDAWSSEHSEEATLRQRALALGRTTGATHFFGIDADEVLTANQIGPVRDAALALEPGWTMRLPWLAMWASLDRYRDDESVWSNNTKMFAFADHPELNFRANRDGYNMHQVLRGTRGEAPCPIPNQSEGGVLHLQFADQRRLLAKHAWYKMAEVIRYPGRRSAESIDEMYNQALDDTGLRVACSPESWWEPYRRWLPAVDLNNEPWYEREVLRFWREHGPSTFAGLDLWGLPQRLETRALAS